MLGISPRYIQTLCQAGYNPSAKHHLGSLRLVLTTGAPLSIEHHDFIKQHVGEKVFLFNGSGGTGMVRQLQLFCELTYGFLCRCL
jgi:acetoacetyl-CoA synthetase